MQSKSGERNSPEIASSRTGLEGKLDEITQRYKGRAGKIYSSVRRGPQDAGGAETQRRSGQHSQVPELAIIPREAGSKLRLELDQEKVYVKELEQIMNKVDTLSDELRAKRRIIAELEGQNARLTTGHNSIADSIWKEQHHFTTLYTLPTDMQPIIVTLLIPLSHSNDRLRDEILKSKNADINYSLNYMY